MVFSYLLLPIPAALATLLLIPPVVGVKETASGVDSTSARRMAIRAALLITLVAVTGLSCAGPFRSLQMCLRAPYSPPPEVIVPSDLVGTWEAHYGRSVDRLILRADGTFQQVYIDHYDEEYTYETDWNAWSIQRLRDGEVRLHLRGARFYQDGIHAAEEGSLGGAASFYDPILGQPVDMRDKLVLHVRTYQGGEIVLYHMWPGADEAFAMTGCERDIFRRVEAP